MSASVRRRRDWRTMPTFSRPPRAARGRGAACRRCTRVLHVDADEDAPRRRVRDDGREERAAEVEVELEPERRELDARRSRRAGPRRSRRARRGRRPRSPRASSAPCTSSPSTSTVASFPSAFRPATVARARRRASAPRCTAPTAAARPPGARPGGAEREPDPRRALHFDSTRTAAAAISSSPPRESASAPMPRGSRSGCIGPCRRVVIMGAGGATSTTSTSSSARTRPCGSPPSRRRRSPGSTTACTRASLAGPLYPTGIPIRPEEELAEIVRAEDVDDGRALVLRPPARRRHAQGVARPRRRRRLHAARAGGDDARGVEAGRRGHRGPHGLRQEPDEPADRLGCSSPPACASALVRHPMPYGDLEAMRVQRFTTLEEIDAAHPDARGARGVRDPGLAWG